MSPQDYFLNPQWQIQSLDIVGVRQAILYALTSQLHKFEGTILDIGCGKMPYKPILLQAPSQVEEYIGLDLAENAYGQFDLSWDGHTIPLENCSINCAIATEVLEHCIQPERVISETFRVLKPGGVFFLTVPFLWPLHDVPYDEYRYTPYSLERLLTQEGFDAIQLKALGGWDASLSQMLGLWVRRRPMKPWKRTVLSYLFRPIVQYLHHCDQSPEKFHESLMINGLSGIAIKPYS